MNHKSFALPWLIAAALLVVMMPLPAMAQPDYSGQWTQLSAGWSEKVERTFHTSVYSPSTNRLIVFGGSVLGTTLDDLWILSNANGLGGTPNWVKQTPLGVIPPARSRHTAVYDAATDRMIVFGGCTSFCTPALNDVWVLKNASGIKPPMWQQLLPAGPWPGQREVATAVYDPGTNTMIVYGGDNGFPGGTFYDVWVLSHANGLGGTPQWNQLSPMGGPPAGGGQRWHSAVYDPINNIMTTFGGYNNNDMIINETWTLTHANGIGGTPMWAKMDVDYGDCPVRTSHRAVYDPIANTMTVFGGYNPDVGLMNDVWLLWNANGLGGSHGWMQLFPTGTLPVPRATPSLNLDPVTNRLIMFGGNAQEGYTFTTWVLTHGNGM